MKRWQPSPKTVTIVSKSPAPCVNKPDYATQDGTNIGKEPFSTHTVTILQKGNSGPFDATTVYINHQVNAILLSYRDCLLPAMYALESDSTPKAQGLRNLQDSISALPEQCTVNSFLTRSALPMSASDDPESKLARQAVAWKVKASAIQRARLDSEVDLDDYQTHRSMFHLLTTELFARHMAGAAIHAKMLSSLLRKCKETCPLDLRFLYKAVYNDVQRASIPLQRPAFDFDVWIPQQFGPSRQ